MTEDGAKRKGLHYPSDVIDLVDDTKRRIEDEVMHLLVDDKRR
jgi:hypothetical protein